jgi:competence protein ComEC
MRVFGEDEGGVPARRGLVFAILDASARLLEAEQDRWMLWVPVLFAAGILTYFALADEPALRLALALVIGALGFCLALRRAPLGLCIGGAALAFALGLLSPSSAPRWCAHRCSR